MDYKFNNFKMEFKVKRLINIQYFEFSKGYETLKESHFFNELVYVDNGEIDIYSDNYKGKLESGEMIIHTSGETHSFSCNKNIASNIIIIGFECNSDSSFSKLSKNPFVLNNKLKEYLSEILIEGKKIFQPPYDIPYLKTMPKNTIIEYGAEQLVHNLIENLIINSIREIENKNNEYTPVTTNDLFIEKVKDYLEYNFYSNLSIDELCNIFNTNRSTICSRFKKLTGFTIKEYINYLRIKQAKIYLREGHYTLTEIADFYNLSSVHYLTQLFKKYEKMSPTEYKNSIKSKFEN